MIPDQSMVSESVLTASVAIKNLHLWGGGGAGVGPLRTEGAD